MRHSFLWLGLSLVLFSCNRSEKKTDYASLVNPFIGTTNGGNTFPGAVVPWGMVSVSPHSDKPGPSGFLYERSFIEGFGHVHFSGTGCPDLGSIVVRPQRGKVQLDPVENQSEFDEQSASPGYYSVALKRYNLQVETSATARSGILRITNRGNDDTIRLVLDAGRSLSWRKGGKVSIQSKQEVNGYTISGGFCGAGNYQHIFFSTVVDNEPLKTTLWKKNLVTNDSEVTSDSLALGSIFEFYVRKGESIVIRTGISYSDEAKAKLNREKEQSSKSFESIVAEAKAEWNKQLAKVEVETTKPVDKIVFYTALYHMLIQPSLYSDIDGTYRTFQTSKIQHSDVPRYNIFSLWDTYRTVHPFYTLVYPAQQKQMVATMLGMYKESGWLPKWELSGKETYVMVGDPAAIVIADSWMKGIIPEDEKLAYEAIKKTSEVTGVENKVSNPIRSGQLAINTLGYIPHDNDEGDWVWGSVASSLEYALADFGISQVAGKLGKKEDQKLFWKKSQIYQHYFDKNSKFLRAKNRSGSWVEPFNPDTIETAGGWPGSGGPGYVEGNAWHYSWFVPHDIKGLIAAYPSPKEFSEKINECFDKGQFILWNEPDMNYPYIFNYLPDEVYKTSTIVHEQLKKYFTNEPSGIPGNDDCGALSGWYVFASMGFYPFCPAATDYALSVPIFDRVTIHLDEQFYAGKTWTIENNLKNREDMLSVKIRVDDIKVTSPWLDHQSITRGGKIVYYQPENELKKANLN